MRWMRAIRAVCKWTCTIVLGLATLAALATRWFGFVWGHHPFTLLVDRWQGQITVALQGSLVITRQFRWRHTPDPVEWAAGPLSWSRQTLMANTMLLVHFWLVVPLALMLLVTLALWFPELRALYRRRCGRCVTCGYDRHGLASAAAPCPECGVVAPSK